MDIGFDAKRLFSNHTGLGNYSRSLVKNLSDIFPENTYHLFSPKTELNPKTSYFFSSGNFRFITSGHTPGSFWRTFLMDKAIKKRRMEIFHGLSNELPMIYQKGKTRYVVTIHDLIFKKLPATYPITDRLIYDLKFRKACESSDQIIAISQSTRADIMEWYGIHAEKIEVVYQSCNPLYYQLPEKEACDAVLTRYRLPSEFIIMVGSVEPRKNLKAVLKAMYSLGENNTIPLLVVGRGKDYRKQCQQMVHDLRLDRRIIWLDNVLNHEDLQCLIHRAVVMVYPSLYEGFGLPVAEALLSKTPAITSQTSSMPEAGGPGALYVNPVNSEEIADAIQKVLNDSILRDQLANDGYSYAKQKFDPLMLTRQMMALYQSIL